jgi:hypothetical protein
MPVTNASPEWTSEDMEIFRAFLNTQTGSRLIPSLAEKTPMPLETGDLHALLIRSGKFLGFKEALTELLTLAFPAPEVKNTAGEYPSLIDDTAWNDGQKIEPKS